MDWVLRIFGTQVIKIKRPIRPVFSDCISVSYDYASVEINKGTSQNTFVSNDLCVIFLWNYSRYVASFGKFTRQYLFSECSKQARPLTSLSSWSQNLSLNALIETNLQRFSPRRTQKSQCRLLQVS